MKTEMYVISTYSNMHVGSGEINFGVIDNLVQRDVLGQLTINSSSLKGALREFFVHNVGNIDDRDDYIRNVFGSEPKERVAERLKQGTFRFFEASLLSIPVRSDVVPYLRATSCEVIKELLIKTKEFGINLGDLSCGLQSLIQSVQPVSGEPVVFEKDLEGAYIEDFDLRATYQEPKFSMVALEHVFGKRLVVLSHENFTRLCDDNHLPVIARNNLNNGESKNLWYEQVVPRFSHFYFVVMKKDEYEEVFDAKISDGLIQIGANASIGYGFSKIQKIENLNISNDED